MLRISNSLKIQPETFESFDTPRRGNEAIGNLVKNLRNRRFVKESPNYRCLSTCRNTSRRDELFSNPFYATMNLVERVHATKDKPSYSVASRGSALENPRIINRQHTDTVSCFMVVAPVKICNRSKASN